MPHYRYLIIGGGMTAAAALAGIRQVDPDGEVGLVSTELHPPYNRPPLSKGLWKGKPLEKIFRKVDFPGVELNLGHRIATLDPNERRAVDISGTIYTYERLLLATGGTPARLPFGDDQVLYFRTLDDYHFLRERTQQVKQHYAVIGGGFIGSELAAVLSSAGQQVSLIFPGPGISARLFPPDLSGFLNDFYRAKGVEVLAGEKATALEQRGKKLVLRTHNARELAVDAVVAGIGLRPNTALAEAAGLQVEDGVVVDQFLRTSQAEIFAAGDVANFFNTVLGRRMRMEHEDNANSMGTAAGQNMAASYLGKELVSYDHLAYFYSDMFELGYEAIGDLNPKLQMVADWQEPYRKGVIYYLNQQRVRGVLLWDTWGQLGPALQLIQEPGPFDEASLKGRLPVPKA